MTDFSEEQEMEIQKRINDARVLEQWTIAEDTLRRNLYADTRNKVELGLLHKFHLEVAETMYSAAITGRVPVKKEEEKKNDE